MEVLDLFVELFRPVAIPKSIAQIYGYVFVSSHPVGMSELVQRLQLSKGAASQGLKFLRQVGALKGVSVVQGRHKQVLYEPELDVRKLLVGLLRERVLAGFNAGQARLGKLNTLLEAVPQERKQHFSGRVDTLRRWERAGRTMVPLLVRMIG
jgi:DNA-binding transcriptional regulator GbsR (MarR family)